MPAPSSRKGRCGDRTCASVHDHQAEHAVSDLCRVIDLPRSTASAQWYP